MLLNWLGLFFRCKLEYRILNLEYRLVDTIYHFFIYHLFLPAQAGIYHLTILYLDSLLSF